MEVTVQTEGNQIIPMIIDADEQNLALSEAINQFKENAMVKFNLPTTLTCVQSLYQQGSQRIVYLLQGIPFDLATKKFDERYDSLEILSPLIQFLTQEETQLKPDLKYKVIRVARIFTECLALQLLYPDHNCELIRLPQKTKAKLLTGFKDAKKGLTLQDVAARYELKCASAAAKNIQTDENKFEKYTEYSSVLIKAIQEQNIFDVVSSIINFSQELYSDISNQKLNISSRQRYGQVRLICWTSHGILNKHPLFSLEYFYQRSISYRTSAKVAFYTLEVLAEFFKQSLQNNDPQAELFLQGNNEKPGLVTFVKLSVSDVKSTKRKLTIARKTDRRISGAFDSFKKITGSTKSAGLTGMVDPFWSVRHRAIEHLHAMAERLDENYRIMISRLFAKQLCVEKVDPVKNLLNNIYVMYYKDNTNWTEIFDEHEDSINEERNKHEKLVESKQSVIKKLKGTGPWESNVEDSLEENIVLSDEQLLDLLELQLQKEMLVVEEDKLEKLY